MALQGLCDYDEVITVQNRGGAVQCCCSRVGGLATTLIGNATYTESGEIEIDGKRFASRCLHTFDEEVAAWNAFLNR
jgi:hypothetical protein